LSNKQSGFSLIEIMIVVVILGILASIIVPKLMNRPDEARIVRAKQDILAIQNALEMYQLDNGDYPTNEQGLEALVTKPSSSPIPTNWQQYLRKLPIDPWQNPYRYKYPGEHGDIDIYSDGPNKKINGEPNIIGNWQLP
jgi:general secretion pathway protein G